MSETLKKITGVYNSNLVFVGAPYTAYLPDGKENVPLIMQRIEKFSLCLEQMLKMGIKPHSPLLMHLVRCYTTKLPGDWEYWGAYSLKLLEKSDIMVVLTIDGWGDSVGLNSEIDHAKKEGIDIVYLNADALLKGELEDLSQFVYEHKGKGFDRPEGVKEKAIGTSGRSSIEFEDAEQEAPEVSKNPSGLSYPAKFQSTNTEGCYVVTFRDIPEATTQVDNKEEEETLPKDALETAFDFYFENNRVIPDPSPLQEGERLVPVGLVAATKVSDHNLKLFYKR